MRKGVIREEATKGRSSIITIGIVLLIIILIAACVILVLNSTQNKEEEKDKMYYSNLDEEDKMQYEYKKIDKSLNGMYALAIVDNYVVAVKSRNEYENIFEIDPNLEYDYLYNDTNLYLLEKNSGILKIIDLKELGNIKETIELDEKIKSFEMYEGILYYISDSKLIKYDNGNKEEILNNVTSDNFVIKKGYIYIVKENNLLKIDITNNGEEILDTNVLELYYYNYYERDRLVYDICSDSENVFKNIYNYYTNDIIKSVKNNTFFVLYNALDYIYTTADNKNVVLVSNGKNNNYLYKSEKELDTVNLFKEGYVIADDVVIDLESREVVENDNIINFKGIKYLK